MTTEITRQVFPITLDIENPKFLEGLERLRILNDRIQAAEAQGGLVGRAKKTLLMAQAAATFGRLYMMTPKENALPDKIGMVPAW